MRPTRRFALFPIPMLAAVFAGCDRSRDRQMVYPSTRGAPVRIDAATPSRVKVESGKVPLPDSNGVDVPIVEPD